MSMTSRGLLCGISGAFQPFEGWRAAAAAACLVLVHLDLHISGSKLSLNAGSRGRKVHGEFLSIYVECVHLACMPRSCQAAARTDVQRCRECSGGEALAQTPKQLQ
jgi:hypothetical protein